jgi:hypothetical protein
MATNKTEDTKARQECKHIETKRILFRKVSSRNYQETYHECLNCGETLYNKEAINKNEPIGLPTKGDD